MPACRLILITLVTLLVGCASMDGKYTPSCNAYEGDRFELRDKQFTWNRFTDERIVDGDGEVVDPFPEHPKKGQFQVRDNVLVLSMADGSETITYVPVRFDGDVYLLTPAENEAYAAGSAMPNCALKRSDR